MFYFRAGNTKYGVRFDSSNIANCCGAKDIATVGIEKLDEDFSSYHISCAKEAPKLGTCGEVLDFITDWFFNYLIRDERCVCVMIDALGTEDAWEYDEDSYDYDEEEYRCSDYTPNEIDPSSKFTNAIANKLGTYHVMQHMLLRQEKGTLPKGVRVVNAGTAKNPNTGHDLITIVILIEV